MPCPRRESYRTLEEAEASMKRWRKRGHKSFVDKRYASIRKFVVVTFPIPTQDAKRKG